VNIMVIIMNESNGEVSSNMSADQVDQQHTDPRPALELEQINDQMILTSIDTCTRAFALSQCRVCALTCWKYMLACLFPCSLSNPDLYMSST
jgi:hypothetical protein